MSSAILSRTWKNQFIGYCDLKRSCMPLVSSTVTGGVKQSPSWAMFTTKPIQALGQKVGVALVSFLQQKSLTLDHINDPSYQPHKLQDIHSERLSGVATTKLVRALSGSDCCQSSASSPHNTQYPTPGNI